MAQDPKSQRYSEAFKRQIVQEHEAGMSINQLRRKYHVGGSMTIPKWIRKYGRLNPDHGTGSETVKDKAAHLQEELEQLRRKNTLLEKAVMQLTLENVLVHSTLELYQECYGAELSKKNGCSSSSGPMRKGKGG